MLINVGFNDPWATATDTVKHKLELEHFIVKPKNHNEHCRTKSVNYNYENILSTDTLVLYYTVPNFRELSLIVIRGVS